MQYKGQYHVYPHLVAEAGGTDNWEEVVVRQAVAEFLSKIPMEKIQELFSVGCDVHSDPHGNNVHTYSLSIKI